MAAVPRREAVSVPELSRDSVLPVTVTPGVLAMVPAPLRVMPPPRMVVVPV